MALDDSLKSLISETAYTLKGSKGILFKYEVYINCLELVAVPALF